MRRWLLGGFAALALVTGACGDGDDKEDDRKEAPGTRDDYVRAFEPGVATMGVTEDQARCVAEAAVDTVGVDRLNQVTNPREIEDQTGSFDMSSFELTEEEGGALYDKIDACVDVFELFIAQNADPSLADCLRQSVTDDMIRAAMVPLFVGAAGAPGEATMSLNEVYATCQSQVGPTTPVTMPSSS